MAEPADDKGQGKSEKSEKAEEPRFTRNELLANARSLTGYRRHMVAGALSGTTQQTFTKTAARKLVESFARRPAETGASA